MEGEISKGLSYDEDDKTNRFLIGVNFLRSANLHLMRGLLLLSPILLAAEFGDFKKSLFIKVASITFIKRAQISHAN